MSYGAPPQVVARLKSVAFIKGRHNARPLPNVTFKGLYNERKTTVEYELRSPTAGGAYTMNAK